MKATINRINVSALGIVVNGERVTEWWQFPYPTNEMDWLCTASGFGRYYWSDLSEEQKQRLSNLTFMK